jgi:hypothetical protein
MKFIKIYFFLFIIISQVRTYGQEPIPEIKSPQTINWNSCSEGQKLSFQLTVSNQSIEDPYNYLIQQGKLIGMTLDSNGVFTWTPSFHLVDRIEKQKIFQIIVEAKNKTGNILTTNIDLKVSHTNRAPIVNELKPFYIQYNSKNSYKIDNESVTDEDNDPIVFIPSIEALPEGMTLSSQGELIWNPSFTQFKNIKEKEMYVDFYVEDQPSKLQTKGRIKLVATQIDLPPAITIVPKDEQLIVRENETVDIRFYLTDPNGDDDIETFDFLTNHSNIPKSSLKKNTANQFEFIWSPGYDFVQDPKDSLTFFIDFFVLDKTQKRDVKRMYFKILNTINETERDQKYYNLYQGTLARAWELNEQLKDKEEELKKAYNRAKKGKKQRSVVNASLGATTSLNSILTKNNPETQKWISTIGGTTVLTISTLEATEVIGKSMKDLIDRLNYVIEKKNELQTKGDVFARDFSLKSARKNPEFIRKVDDYMTTMNLKGLVALELDAGWEPKIKLSDAAIKKTFKDFNPNTN